MDTNKSYQIKKVERAVQELMKDGEGIKWWNIYDKAGLNEKEIVCNKSELKLLVEDIKIGGL